MSVRIIIYEDSDHLRSSLCSLFQWNNEMNVLLASSNPSEILKDVEELKPDVILMDIDMPVMNGIEAVTLLRSNNSTIPVIMLTIFEDAENIYNAICAGATGYLLKNDFEHIIYSIKDVLNGGAPMTGSVARKVLNSFAKPVPVKKESLEQLTARENEILKELEAFGTVEIDTNHTIVSIVGNEIAETKDVMKKIFDALEPIPVRMVSYGGSKHNVSLLIARANKDVTLQLLNKGLFNL